MGENVDDKKSSTSVAEGAFVENAGGAAVNVDSTFRGYTVQQLAQALHLAGIIA